MKIIQLVLLLVTAISFGSCSTDESVLNDYDLFGRLQSGSGTWEVTSISTRDNSVPNPTENTITPDNTFYHFFIQTIQVGSVLVDKNYAVQYVNNSKEKASDIEAENQRVVFTNGLVLGGEVWTVVENDTRTQVWEYVSGSTTTKMMLSKCNCTLPETTTTENGG